jgi:hypothetical protein
MNADKLSEYTFITLKKYERLQRNNGRACYTVSTEAKALRKL